MTPLYNSVKFGQGGCRFCSVSGLKWDQPTALYLAVNGLFHKIGIANNSTLTKRLGKHQKAGLKPVALFQFDLGDDAYSVEQVIVDWWRSECNSGPVPRDVLPDGWTETVFNDDVLPSTTLAYPTNELALKPIETD